MPSDHLIGCARMPHGSLASAIAGLFSDERHARLQAGVTRCATLSVPTAYPCYDRNTGWIFLASQYIGLYLCRFVDCIHLQFTYFRAKA